MECLVIFNPHQCEEQVPKNCPKTAIVYANYKCPVYLCTVPEPPIFLTPMASPSPSTSLLKSMITTTTHTTLTVPTIGSTSVKVLLTSTIQSTTTLKQLTIMSEPPAAITSSCSSSLQFYQIWAIATSCKSGSMSLFSKSVTATSS